MGFKYAIRSDRLHFLTHTVVDWVDVFTRKELACLFLWPVPGESSVSKGHCDRFDNAPSLLFGLFNYLGAVKYIALILLCAVLASCASVSTLTESQLTTGYYRYRPDGEKEFSKVYVESEEDTIVIIPHDKDGKGLAHIGLLHGQVFRKPSFDIDVMVVVFKYRPSSYNFPSQLTADFNGNVFMGYRLDQYTMEVAKTPGKPVRRVRQRAISVGGFAGLGTSFISPWTTNYRTTDEYSGFILSHGFSAMAGFKSVTFGLSVGWDNLTDRDKDLWIYQNSAWYGVTLSLNLN